MKESQRYFNKSLKSFITRETVTGLKIKYGKRSFVVIVVSRGRKSNGGVGNYKSLLEKFTENPSIQ